MKAMLILLALAGCERADKDVPKTKLVKVENAWPKVVLREPGSEPRRVLRLRQRPSTETYEIRASTIYDWSGVREVAPTTTMRNQRSVVEVHDDGAFRESWKTLDITYDPPTVDEAYQRFTWLRGATFTQWVDPRGMVQGDTTAVLDERLQPADYDSDNTLFTLALPDEPIGIGARWNIEAEIRLARATIVAELVAIDGDVLVIKTSFDHTTNRVGKLKATGQGNIRLDLTGPASSAMYIERGSGTLDGQPVTYETTTKFDPVKP